jgi:hypothetical protein
MNVTRPGNSAPALPKLLVGQRRKLMALLVGTGLGMAALSGASAFLMAAALTLIGLLASHVTDLGRVAEYRQSFNAAKRMIGPALPPAMSAEPAKQEPRDPTADNPGAAARTGTEAKAPADLTVRISGLHLSGNRPVPDLVSYPGDRILLKTVDPGEATELFEALLALREDPPLDTWVGDRDLRSVSGAERRGLAGYAAKGAFTERGTIARAVRYRRPDLPPDETAGALARVGLTEKVARLPKGEHTMLQRGGEPLSGSDRARLQIARATLGNPPLLLLNHVDFDLAPEGCEVLANVLRSYPGVAIIASDYPEQLVATDSIWDLRPAKAATSRHSDVPDPSSGAVAAAATEPSQPAQAGRRPSWLQRPDRGGGVLRRRNGVMECRAAG